jgi:hypothetical protein
MVRALLLCLLAAGGLLPAPAARADDKEARALVDKAVRAHGGDRLLRVKAVETRGKMTVEKDGVKAEGTDEKWLQFPDRFKVAAQVSANGIDFTLTYASDGKKAWVQTANETKDLDDAVVKGLREETLHVEKVARLLFAREKGYELSVVGEGQVDGRAALGVRVARKGRPDVNLYFDKATGLLAKLERRGTDATGREVTEERFFHDYKEVGGVRTPMRVVHHHDGRQVMEWECAECRLLEEALPDEVFRKPQKE